MRAGIVGHGQEKFTPRTEALARDAICHFLIQRRATVVVSGHSPLGGVDIYAEEIAAELGIPTDIKSPRQLKWDAEYGYKQRNLDIARSSDIVLCVVVAYYPASYTGMRFATCYHCGLLNPGHIKSGGCWTAHKAQRAEWRIIK